ncbi:hypothetical protein [Agromyces aerolatus]|uniref:hypothetical protein n=1 Tax=Agromyces sp. LY-1074 TaxID=3074080 RepID=UPI00286648AD|nr:MULTISPECIES: hypothetical protein [unclassified Agromyces]MDR5701675.1 hypothetical protein [Agromyces sp. LY-1074]MDR5707978.1 hypothetical protein [Agromyces sp. LY-1358]
MTHSHGTGRAGWSSRGLRWAMVLVSATALVAGVGVPVASAVPVGQVSAGDGVVEPAARASDAVTAVPAALGVTAPSRKNEVAADVLGLGYEQVVRLNGSKVEIAEPVTRGSKVLRSFEAGASKEWPVRGSGSTYPLYYGGTAMTLRVADHVASRLAVAGDHIYVSNLRTRELPSGVRVEDGSVVTKYSVDGEAMNSRVEGTDFAITALDGFEWKGREYLAIGLNQLGVRIVDTTVNGMPDRHTLMWHYSGSLRSDSRNGDQITDLRFGVEGDRVLLVVGAMTKSRPALLAFDAASGDEIWAKNFRRDEWDWEWPEALAIGPFGPGGQVQVAAGWPTLGQLEVMDAVSGVERGRIGGGVVSVARFFSDALSGEPRLAFRRGIGTQFDSHLVKPDPTGAPIVIASTEASALERMVPGVRVSSVRIENRSRSAVDVQAFTGSSRAQGCWLGAGLHGVTNPLPAQPVSIPTGGLGGPYVTAQQLWGEACGEHPGVFTLQVGPQGEGAQRQLLQLHADAHGLRIVEQVGGDRLVASVESDGGLGVRLVIDDRHEAPTIMGAPVVEVTRLTPAEAPGRTPTENVNDPSRPVHRFTVSGVSWNVPGAGTELSDVALPLSLAEGSVDGEQWDTLGTIASPLTPTRDGDRITLGEAVFDWQTAPGAQKDYRFIRVSAGGASSNVIDVQSPIPAPAPTDLLKGTGGAIAITGAGMPRANGLDQAPMRVTLYSKSRALDVVQHAELYRRIYFRDATSKALITGLGDPAEPTQLIMFSLHPGQYANDGLSAASTTSIGVYFSARFRQLDRQVMAVVKGDGVEADGTFSSAPLRPTSNVLAPTQTSTGAGGVSIGSCAEGACLIADPEAAPALYDLKPTTFSVQFRAVAVPGTASLPLVLADRMPEELELAEDTFEVRGSRATLRNPNGFSASPTVSGHVVSHGERVALDNVYVTAR